MLKLIKKSTGLWIIIGLCLVQSAIALMNDEFENKASKTPEDNHISGNAATADIKPDRPAQRRKPFRVVQADREKKHLDLNLLRKKRFVSVMLSPFSVRKNKTFQECTTPSGEKGHCKRYQHCKTMGSGDNLWKLLGQLCVIENM
ncbi:hypothetical protein RP20_CCG012336 [Aedes albopictus]|nr:hypothetical protein RP20_CCG012336 [Aedes albopictus]